MFKGDGHALHLRSLRRELFDSPHFSDVVVKVRGREFHAHRLILAEASTVFERMLTTELVENGEGVIDVAEVDEGVVEFALRRVYGSIEEIPTALLLDVLRFADMYEITGPRAYCLQRLIDEMDIQNLFHSWRWAEFYHCKELMVACVEHARADVNCLTMSPQLSSFGSEDPISCLRFLKKLNKATVARVEHRGADLTRDEATDIEDPSLTDASIALQQVEVVKRAIINWSRFQSR